MYIHEYIRTTICQSVIPVREHPNQSEVLALARTYIGWSIEACQAIKLGKLNFEIPSKSPNISIIALDFFRAQKRDQFSELDQLTDCLNEVLKTLIESKAGGEKALKTKEGIAYFLGSFLPPLRLSIEARILINTYIQSQHSNQLPVRLKAAIQTQLERKINKDVLTKIQDLGCIFLPQHEASLLQAHNVRKINRKQYVPRFFEVNLALNVAKARNFPIIVTFSQGESIPYVMSESYRFEKSDWKLLDKESSALVIDFYARAHFQDNVMLEDVLLTDAVSSLQYPKSLENSTDNATSDEEPEKTMIVNSTYKQYQSALANSQVDYQVNSIRACTIGSFLKEAIPSES